MNIEERHHEIETLKNVHASLVNDATTLRSMRFGTLAEELDTVAQKTQILYTNLEEHLALINRNITTAQDIPL